MSGQDIAVSGQGSIRAGQGRVGQGRAVSGHGGVRVGQCQGRAGQCQGSVRAGQGRAVSDWSGWSARTPNSRSQSILMRGGWLVQTNYIARLGLSQVSQSGPSVAITLLL